MTKHIQHQLNRPETLEKMKTISSEHIEMISFLGWHELYHAGQLGILRRIAGLGGAIQ